MLTLLPLQEEKEKRRLEQLERKKETQRLLEEEDSRLKGGKAPRVAPAKVTRAQIEDSLRKEQRAEPGAHVAWGRPPRTSPIATFSHFVPVTRSGKGQEPPGAATGGEPEPAPAGRGQLGGAHCGRRHSSAQVGGVGLCRRGPEEGSVVGAGPRHGSRLFGLQCG